MSSKKKVLILNDTAILGGPGKGILQYLRHYHHDDTEFVVGVFESRRHTSSEYKERLLAENHEIRIFRERFRFDPGLILQVLRELRNGEYDILQTHGYKTHLLGMIAKKRLGIPWLAFLHGWTAENFKVKFYHALDRYSIRAADTVVAVSQDLEQFAVDARGSTENIHFVPNAIDSEVDLKRDQGGEAVREKLGVKADELLIGVFARLSPEKGHRFLLRALAAERENLPPFKVVIAGRGPERESIERLRDELGLAEQVLFAGYTRYMRDYFEAIDLLVLPSLLEGLPNVILEAAVMGVPAMACDVGAVRFVIEDGVNGWVLEPGSVDSLRKKLRTALSDKERRQQVAKEASERVFPRFAPDTRANFFHDLYLKLAPTPQGSTPAESERISA